MYVPLILSPYQTQSSENDAVLILRANNVANNNILEQERLRPIVATHM